MLNQGLEPLDSHLVRSAQAGDPKAFERLVARYQHRVLKIVTRFIQDPDESLDVCQEVFIKIYRA